MKTYIIQICFKEVNNSIELHELILWFWLLLLGYILFRISLGFISSREFKNFSTNIHWFFLGIFKDSVSQTVMAGKGSWSTGNPTSSIVVSTGWESQYFSCSATMYHVVQNSIARKIPHVTRSIMRPCTTYLKPGIVLSEKNATSSFLICLPGAWDPFLWPAIAKNGCPT